MTVIHLDAWRAFVILRQCLGDLALRLEADGSEEPNIQAELTAAQSALDGARGEQPRDAHSPAPERLLEVEWRTVHLIRRLVPVDDPDADDQVAMQCAQAVDLLA